MPLPLDAMLSLPGLRASRSGSGRRTSLMPSACAFAGFITSTLGTPATSVIGAKSLIGSYGIFG